MSILKSTNTGKYQKIDKLFFIEHGFVEETSIVGISRLHNKEFSDKELLVIGSSVLFYYGRDNDVLDYIEINSLYRYNLLMNLWNSTNYQETFKVKNLLNIECKHQKMKNKSNGTWWTSTQSLYTGAYKPSLMNNPYNPYSLFPTIDF